MHPELIHGGSPYQREELLMSSPTLRLVGFLTRSAPGSAPLFDHSGEACANYKAFMTCMNCAEYASV